MHIVVAGASGFLGSHLIPRLRGDGHTVLRLVRRAAKRADERQWDPAAGKLDPAVLDGADAVVNLAGAPVAPRRWTDGYKRLIMSSRVDSTATLAGAMAAAAEPPGVLVNASAIGYYGDTGDRAVEEDEPAGTGFFPETCGAWEDATAPAARAGIRVVLLRSGLVLARSGGLLKPMIVPFWLGFGARLGSGRQYMSWISLADEIDAILFVLGADAVSGPVNLTAPNPVTNAEFTRALARALHRPAFLAMPRPVLRVAAGEFGNDAVVSQRVLPGVLGRAGFRFTHEDLTDGLPWALRH